jgi:thymidine phosphorylase
LVLDIKLGNGAFIPAADQAEELARTMIAIGTSYGKRVVARMTAMDRPLGHAVGNALEIAECLQTLQNGGPTDLREVTLALAADMLVLGGQSATLDEGRDHALRALADGRALEQLRRIIAAQHGDARVLDEPGRLPQAPLHRPVPAPRAGIVEAMDVRAIGQAAVALGAGRARLGATIDPAVGFHIPVKPGMRVAPGEPLATVFARDEDSAAAATAALLAAIRIGAGPAPALPLIGARLTDAT